MKTKEKSVKETANNKKKKPSKTQSKPATKTNFISLGYSYITKQTWDHFEHLANLLGLDDDQLRDMIAETMYLCQAEPVYKHKGHELLLSPAERAGVNRIVKAIQDDTKMTLALNLREALETYLKDEVEVPNDLLE